MPDQLAFVPNDHDVRVQLGDRVYFVRAVRRGELLGGARYDGQDALVLVMLHLAFGWAIERWQQRQPWKVGVVRARGDRWGATGAGRAEVVHRELVPGPEVPVARLAELADRVRAGGFST